MNRLFSFASKRSYLWSLLFCVLASSVSIAQADTYEDFIFAVKFDDIQTVQALLKKGVDVNSTESVRGETAMMIALREKSNKVFEILLKHPDIKLEVRADNGDTALMLASYLQNVPAVNQLVNAGAMVNQQGWTALHYAAAIGDTQIMLSLLDKAANINAGSPNKTTPLMMAVRSGNTAAVQLLLDKGANIQAINDLGLSALDFAIQLEKREIAAVLSSYIKRDVKPH